MKIKVIYISLLSVVAIAATSHFNDLFAFGSEPEAYFKSVEIGIAETSPNGAAGGYAIPASGGSAPTSIHSPLGSHDAYDASCTISWGWACDEDNFNTALNVGFYEGSTYLGSVSANLVREAAVGLLCGGNSTHGFNFTIPASLKTGTDHSLQAIAYDIGPSGGSNQSLGTLTVNCPAPVVPVNGSCGTAKGTTVSSLPLTNLCSSGTYSYQDTTASDGTYNWHCEGSGGGSTDTSCYANKTAATCTWPGGNVGNWGNGLGAATTPCTGTQAAIVKNEGQTLSVTNTAGGYSGSITYTCQPSGSFTPTAATCVASSFSCINPVANATLYDAEESTSLAANTNWTYAASDTTTKCQFSCNATYTWNGSSCVPASYSCINPVANATLYDAEESTSLAANTNWTYAASDTATKCQFSCNATYTWNGSSCVSSGNTNLTSRDLPWVASGSLTQNTSVNFGATTQNSGTTNITTWFENNFEYRWGTSGAWTEFDTPYIGSISSGATPTDTSVPLLLSNTGTLQIKHCVDWVWLRISESDESVADNCKTQTFNVVAGGASTNLSSRDTPWLASGTLTQNTNVTFGGTLQNSGTTNISSAFYDNFTACWGSGCTPSTMIGSHISEGSIASGVSRSDTSAPMLLTNTGALRVQHCVDSNPSTGGGAIGESDESSADNCKIKEFTVNAAGGSPCPAGTPKNWTVSSSCSGTTPSANDGQLGTVSDSVAPDVGSAQYLCTNGVWAASPQVGATCSSGGAQPNLRAGLVSPITATEGVSRTFSAAVQEMTGAAGTGAGFNVLFQRANDSFGNGRVDIGYESTAALGAGLPRTINHNYTFPAQGTFYLRACADKSSEASLGVIPETFENDNCGTWQSIAVSAAAAAPNLVSQNLVPSAGPYTSGTVIVLNAQVRNIGSVTTGIGFNDDFTYQWNGTGGAWNSFPGNTTSRLALGPSGAADDKVNFTPGQAGNLYIQHCVDSANVIPEGANESPNCSVAGPFTVGASAGGCPAQTVANCALGAGTNGQNIVGACAGGYTGSCNYMCSGGIYTIPSNNTCSLAPIITTFEVCDYDGVSDSNCVSAPQTKYVDPGAWLLFRWITENATYCQEVEGLNFTTSPMRDANGIDRTLASGASGNFQPYTIACGNGGAPVSRTVNVQTSSAAPDLNSGGNQSRLVPSGTTVVIDWNTGATAPGSCTIVGPGAPAALGTPTGSFSTPAINAQVTYTITCGGGGPGFSDSFTIRTIASSYES